MTSATIAAKYGTAPRNAWTGVEKIPLDVSGADGVGLASTLKTYVTTGLASTSQIREKLTTVRVYNVATTGNDTTGDGSVGLPWASPQHAWEYICHNIDLAGQEILINFAAGTYGPLAANNPVLSLSNHVPVGGFGSWFMGASPTGRVTFAGQLADRTLVKLTGTYGAIFGASVLFTYSQPHCAIVFRDMQLIGPAAATNSIVFAEDCAMMEFINVDIGGGGDHYAFIHTHVRVYGEYTILSGASASHLVAHQLAEVEYTPILHIPAPVAFSGSFLEAQENSWIGVGGLGTTFNDPTNAVGYSMVVLSGGNISLGTDLAMAGIPGTLGASTYGGYITSFLGSDPAGDQRWASLSVDFKLSGYPNSTDVVPFGFAMFNNMATNRVNLFYSDDGTLFPPLLHEKLSGPTTFYIATTGSDVTGQGTSGLPWKNPQFAWDYISRNIDSQGYTITISCGAGTYNQPVAGQPLLNTGQRGLYATHGAGPIGGGIVSFVGQSDRTLVKWINTDAAIATVVYTGGAGLMLEFHNIQMASTGAGSGHLIGGDCQGGYIQTFNCDVGPARGSTFYAGDYTNIWIQGTYSILGGSVDSLISVGTIFAQILMMGSALVPANATFTSGPYEGIFDVQGTGSLRVSATFDHPERILGQKFYTAQGFIIYSSADGSGLIGGLPGTIAGLSEWNTNIIEDKGNIYGTFGQNNAKAGLPLSTDMEPKSWGVFKNTTDGKVYVAYNDAGTIKKVELV